MIPPRQQWALLIDITNACHLHCSNCTRLLDHARQRYFMSVECAERAILALKDFVTDSEPHPRKPRPKCIGLMGGEPLLHPEFPAIVDLMVRHIPDVRNRGLWTSRDWKTGSHPKWGPYQPQVERLVGPHGGTGREGGAGGWLNWNMHLPEMQVKHQPVLVASKDVVPDERERWNLIERCWLQRDWSSAVTPKGFFFCEVAAHFDMVFEGPGGLPLEPGVWRGDLSFVTDEHGIRRPTGPYAEQINRWCERCGVNVPLAGRADAESTDDISASNFIPLQQLNSPRVRKGDYVLVQPEAQKAPEEWRPRKYVKGKMPKDQSAAARGAR